MPFSQIIPPSSSPTESKRLFYTSVSLLLALIQGYCYHLSKFHIYALVKKGNAKECSNYCTIALISHASKVMLKIFEARLQQYMNRELLDVQAGYRKGRGTRDQIANIRWIIEKAKEFQKNIYFCFIDYAKAFDCVDHNTRPPDLPLEKHVCRSGSNS